MEKQAAISFKTDSSDTCGIIQVLGRNNYNPTLHASHSVLCVEPQLRPFSRSVVMQRSCCLTETRPCQSTRRPLEMSQEKPAGHLKCISLTRRFAWVDLWSWIHVWSCITHLSSYEENGSHFKQKLILCTVWHTWIIPIKQYIFMSPSYII